MSVQNPRSLVLWGLYYPIYSGHFWIKPSGNVFQELTALLRGLQHETPFARRRFFEQIGGCRRRAVGDWAERPIAVALTVPSEFEILVQRIRAVRLRETISGKGLGDLEDLEKAFGRFGEGFATFFGSACLERRRERTSGCFNAGELSRFSCCLPLLIHVETAVTSLRKGNNKLQSH